MTAISTISTKYQVTIPKEVRKFLDFLQPNTQVSVYTENKRIIIERVPLIADLVGILPAKPKIFKKTAQMSASELKLKADTLKTVKYKKEYGKDN